MWRRLIWSVPIVLVTLVSTCVLHAAALVPQSDAKRCGLTRAWYAQVGSPQATGPVSHVNYSDGVLLVQTTAGVLTALDAETGRTLWGRQVGPRGRWTSEAAANKGHIAVVVGSKLYILERETGTLLWERQLVGVPGAGPELSETYAFVPMINGQIEGYAVDGSTKFSPWVYKSAGHVLNSPMTTPQTVSWTTQLGYFYVAGPNGEGVRYRLETNDAIHARPGYWTPNLYAGSINGFVYAVDEASARINWKYSIGEAIHEPPVAIEDKVFVISQYRGMTCLDAAEARLLWVAPGIAQFLSASDTRLYAVDKVGRLQVLDIATGTQLASMPLVDVPLTVTNPASDRIYLVGASGAVQCLHELRQQTPTMHVPPAPDVKALPTLRDRSAESEEETPHEEPPASVPSDSPFGEDMGSEAPAGVDADDPFAIP
jgi:outer membrane protein assembly factor BamB